MPTGWVLINTEPGSEADVLKDLKKIAEVQEVYAVYGIYDIIAKVKADTMDRLKEILTYKVRRLNRIRSTLTMIAIEEGSTTKH
jgi:DNA-binding Lrp family transcriptional regulator